MNSQLEQRLWRRVNFYISFLRLVPFLRMVAVCNNLSFSKVSEDSDIDLFIVAKKGRLFTVRILVTAILHFLGVRRHGDKIAGRFCLSFFIDDSHADLSSIAIDNDYYLSFWLKGVMPIIDDGFYAQFQAANPWVDSLVLNGFENRVGRKFGENLFFAALRNFFSIPFLSFWGDWIESRLRNWQLRRSRAKALLASAESSLIVEHNILKFHNLDRRAHYRDLLLYKYGKKQLSREHFLEVFD